MNSYYKLNYFNDSRDLFLRSPITPKYGANQEKFVHQRPINTFLLYNNLLQIRKNQNTLIYVKISHIIEGMEAHSYEFLHLKAGESIILPLRASEVKETSSIYLTYALNEEKVYTADLTLEYRKMYQSNIPISAFYFQCKRVRRIVPLDINQKKRNQFILIAILTLVLLILLLSTSF